VEQSAKLRPRFAWMGNGAASPRRSGTLSRCSSSPPHNTGDPPRGSGDPPHGSGAPPRGSGDPPHGSGDPPRSTGAPPHGSGAPPRGAEDPPHGSGDPPRNPGDPPRGAGGQPGRWVSPGGGVGAAPGPRRGTGAQKGYPDAPAGRRERGGAGWAIRPAVEGGGLPDGFAAVLGLPGNRAGRDAGSGGRASLGRAAIPTPGPPRWPGPGDAARGRFASRGWPARPFRACMIRRSIL
jgi:hypothetical protein